VGLVAVSWLALAISAGFGVRKIPSVYSVAPLPDAECPTVSILFAARDEEENISDALATFLALDYPRYEVVAVDDRSADSTNTILRAAAQSDPCLKVLRVDSLPAGWLGKPHALQRAYENSSGEWLVLTDADVHFAPDLLRRAIALAEKNQWDHLPLLADAKLFTFGEKMVMTFFACAFVLATRPWSVSNPKSGAYIGIGAFQLIRRSVYEKMGTHRRLAMEVVDDVKVGKLVKEAGCRSGVGKAGPAVSVHWHAGVRNLIRGTEKNFFAAANYSLWMAGAQLFSIFMACAAVRTRMGWDFGRGRDCGADDGAGWGGAGVSGIDAVRADPAGGRADFLVDAAAVHDHYSAKRRDYLARHFLFSGETEERRCIRRFRFRKPGIECSTLNLDTDVPMFAVLPDGYFSLQRFRFLGFPSACGRRQIREVKLRSAQETLSIEWVQKSRSRRGTFWAS